MWESILGVVFLVIIILGIISFLILKLLKLIEYSMDFKRFMDRKLRKVKQIANPDVENQLQEIDPVLYQTLLDYFKNFASVRKYSKYASPSFIREVYYATLQVPLAEIELKEMIAGLNKYEKDIIPLASYEFMSVQQVPGKDCVTIQVARKWRGNEQDTAKYIFEKIDDQWRAAHILRTKAGSIYEILEMNGDTGYLVGDEMYTMFFVDSHNREYEIGDQVIMEGYLETRYYLHGNFFYHVEESQRVYENTAAEYIVH